MISQRALDSRSHDSSDIIAALRSESFPIGIKSDNQAPHLNASLPADSSLLPPPLSLPQNTNWMDVRARPGGELTPITQSPCYMRMYIPNNENLVSATARQIRGCFAPPAAEGESAMPPRRDGRKCSLTLNETLIGCGVSRLIRGSYYTLMLIRRSRELISVSFIKST